MYKNKVMIFMRIICKGLLNIDINNKYCTTFK